MKNKPKNPIFEELAKNDPELADILADIKRKEEMGILRDDPWTYRDCKDWRDAWLYVFRRAKLHPDRHMKLNGDAVTCVAWIGPSFNDKIVAALEKAATRVGESRDLLELRLIATRVGPQGVVRLRTLFPKAAITIYSWEDKESDPSLGNVRDN